MFENFGVSTPTTELTKQVSDAARPGIKFTNKTIDVYNSKINYAGKWTWDPISVKLRDDVTGSVTKLIGEQNQKQFDFFEQSSAASGVDYKFLMRIEMLDGGNGGHTPSVLETWECYGCYVVTTTYDTLDYKTDDPMLITLSIQPDNCIQTTGGANAPNGRSQGTLTTGVGTRI